MKDAELQNLRMNRSTGPMGKITVRINEQILLRAKHQAVDQRMSLAELIERMLDRYVPKANNKGE